MTPEHGLLRGTHWNQRLLQNDVLRLRALFEMGCRKADLARWFGVNKTTVGRAIAGKTWRYA